MDENQLVGRHVVSVLRGLKGLPDDGPELQRRVAQELTKAGFEVEQEYPVVYWRGLRGRLNIVARHGKGVAAIELNRRKPRKRSIGKLQGILVYRILALRGRGATKPTGVDDVVTLDIAPQLPDPRRFWNGQQETRR